MRVLVFGDSITQGYWDTGGGWVNYLREFYDKRQIQDLRGRDEPTIFNLGVSADTSEDIMNRMNAESLARTRNEHKPAIVVQIGVNDSSIESGRERVALEAYRQNLSTIIDVSKKVASKLVFVGSSACDESQTTPVFWGDYHYTNERIKRYERAMHDAAQEHGIAFIPVFDSFLAAVESGEDLLPDGLHPNLAGHKLVYEIVKPKLDELLAD